MTDAADPSTVRTRVVVGVDGSAASERALLWAQYLAGVTGDSLEVVNAWQPPTSYGLMGGLSWGSMSADWNPAGAAEKIVTETVSRVFGKHVPVNLSVSTREGNPARVLLDASEGARLLVVGSRGHGGFTGLLLGSVSAACTEHATCPVLVVHGDTLPPPVI